MKIMGINCGRPGGNTEVLLKEALMACEAQGAEVVWLNLHDAKINPCLIHGSGKAGGSSVRVRRDAGRRRQDIQRALRNMIRENVCVEIDNHGASIAQRNHLCLSALYRNEGLEKQKYQD